MEFKNTKASFESKLRFSDDMKRFVNEEAARFTTDSNEAASASLDDVAEKTMRISAEKHKGNVKEKEKILKGMKEEGRQEQSRFSDSKEKLLKASGVQTENKFSESPQKQEGGNFTKTVQKGESAKFSDPIPKTDGGKFTEPAKGSSGTAATGTTEKNVKAEKKTEQKKAASKTAVASMFRAKKEMSNDLVRDQVSGDALKDGNTGLLRVATEYLNPMRYVKSLCAKIGMAVAPYILGFMAIAAVAVIIISLMFSVLQPISEVGDALSGFIGTFTGDGGGLRNTAFSDSEIDEIVEKSGADKKQEKVIRFALSKVGYPYSQDLRTSGKAYDCSSLAYYSWKEAGVDISYGTNYPPTAAEGARMLKADGKSLSTMDLQPGDLIYYGGEANGRYLGIYHVAIYVGNGKAAEALCTKYGVVYQTLRTNNAIMVCRPNMK